MALIYKNNNNNNINSNNNNNINNNNKQTLKFQTVIISIYMITLHWKLRKVTIFWLQLAMYILKSVHNPLHMHSRGLELGKCPDLADQEFLLLCMWIKHWITLPRLQLRHLPILTCLLQLCTFIYIDWFFYLLDASILWVLSYYLEGI